MRLIPTSITQKFTGSDPNDPTGGMTLDALMERQKMLQQQRPEIPTQIASPWQGASLMANSFVNSLQQAKVQAQQTAGRDLMAQTIAGIDPVKGATPEQQATLMRVDPQGVGMKYVADAMQARRAQIAQAHDDAMKREGWGVEAQMAQKKLDAEMAAAQVFKPNDIGALRDDYTKAATVYDQASPAWQSMKEAAATSLNTKVNDDATGKGASDYNMIVGFAKLLDPNSVVREGEVTSATNLGGMLDSVKGWLNQVSSKGKLDNNVRLAIMNEANSRIKSYYDQAKQKHDWITGVATRHGVRPEDAVPPLGEFGAWEKPAEFMTDDELKAIAGGGQQ